MFTPIHRMMIGKLQCETSFIQKAIFLPLRTLYTTTLHAHEALLNNSMPLSAPGQATNITISTSMVRFQ